MFLHHVLRHRAHNFVIRNSQMSCFFSHNISIILLYYKNLALRYICIVQQYFVRGIQRSKNRGNWMSGRRWKTVIRKYSERKWTNWLKVDKLVFYWYLLTPVCTTVPMRLIKTSRKKNNQLWSFKFCPLDFNARTNVHQNKIERSELLSLLLIHTSILCKKAT